MRKMAGTTCETTTSKFQNWRFSDRPASPSLTCLTFPRYNLEEKGTVPAGSVAIWEQKNALFDWYLKRVVRSSKQHRPFFRVFLKRDALQAILQNEPFSFFRFLARRAGATFWKKKVLFQREALRFGSTKLSFRMEVDKRCPFLRTAPPLFHVFFNRDAMQVILQNVLYGLPARHSGRHITAGGIMQNSKKPLFTPKCEKSPSTRTAARF